MPSWELKWKKKKNILKIPNIYAEFFLSSLDKMNFKISLNHILQTVHLKPDIWGGTILMKINIDNISRLERTECLCPNFTISQIYLGVFYYSG